MKCITASIWQLKYCGIREPLLSGTSEYVCEPDQAAVPDIPNKCVHHIFSGIAPIGIDMCSWGLLWAQPRSGPASLELRDSPIEMATFFLIGHWGLLYERCKIRDENKLVRPCSVEENYFPQDEMKPKKVFENHLGCLLTDKRLKVQNLFAGS